LACPRETGVGENLVCTILRVSLTTLFALVNVRNEVKIWLSMPFVNKTLSNGS
jgi:hypothetical protein